VYKIVYTLLCRVNDSKYGLQAGIFSHDLDKAWYAFEHIEVGGVVWNHVPSVRVDAQVSSRPLHHSSLSIQLEVLLLRSMVICTVHVHTLSWL
jgi:acyl-CoA reductase-like NAD-dependent aldehyde dehydrogenase